MKYLLLFFFTTSVFASENQGYDFSLSAFYAASKGNFREQIKQTGTTLNSTQNSILTLGISGGVFPRAESHYFYSWSFYLSQLRSGETTLGEKVNPPMEWGANLYYNHLKKDWTFTPYVGIDVERFATFNSDEASVSGEALTFRQHQVTYATVGLSKAFRIDQLNFFAKASLSYSLLSSSDINSSLSEENFTGIKYILFLAFSLNELTSFQMFWKRHNMSGPTELDIERFGIGLGYKFF